MKLIILILLSLLSLSGSCQIETNEIRTGLDVNPHTQHVTIGYKKTLLHYDIIMVGSVYGSFGVKSEDEWSVMFGMGYQFNHSLNLVLYPVWYRHFAYSKTYLTPITLLAGYKLKGIDALLFEIGPTYMDYKLYPQIRLTYGLEIRL